MFEQKFQTAFWSQKHLNNHLPHVTLHVKLVSVTKGLLLHSENCISTFESLNVPLYRERERERENLFNFKFLHTLAIQLVIHRRQTMHIQF